jgi:hypothetical protein
VTTGVEQVHQGTDKEATVGAKHHAVIIGQLGQELLHELDDPVAGIGAAGTQPRLEDFLGVGAKRQQRVVGGGTPLMGVVALRRALPSIFRALPDFRGS